MTKTKKVKTLKTKLPLNTEIKALIFVSNDKEPEVVTIKKYAEDFFNYKGRSYKIDFEKVMFFKRKKLLFGSVLYLFYHYDNLEPLCISDELRSIENKKIPNTIIHTALMSDAIKKANDIKNGGLFEDNLKYILIAGAVIIALYFMFGG